MMESSTKLILARALDGLTRSDSHQYGVGTDLGIGKNGTIAAERFIAALVFAESKSVRTSTIILAAFDALAALATASSILYDCYWASKRCNPKFKASKFCVSSIHPAETFPLILAIGIITQALAFAGIQGTGLQALTTRNCGLIGQFMLPALFIVPYIQLVFGVECALRSLRKLPFQARGKYDVTICCVVIVLMLIGTWIPSHINPQPDNCFASLIWFITRFGVECLILLSVAGGLMIMSAITIFVKLSTVNLIDQHQRIAASRMVYYLVLGILSLAFVIPFFVTVVVRNAELKAAMIATVVLNLSGLMNGLLQLFLRSNTATTSFGPKSGRSYDRGRHEIRIWGPNELVFNNQLIDPVSGPRTPAELPSGSESRTNLVGPEKDRPISMESLSSPPPIRSPIRYNPLRSNAVGEVRTMPHIAEQVSELPSSPPKRTHARKQSYSLFPTDPTSPVKSPPAITREDTTSIYDISDLQPPPAIFGGGLRGPGHRRDSSIASSATVQIGLRISHAPSLSQEAIMELPLPSTTYNANANRSIAPPRIETEPAPKLSSQPFSSSAHSPRRPSPLNTNLKSPTQSSPVRGSCTNKTLPPTPKGTDFVPDIQRIAESTTQLSPAVYSPEKKFAKALTTPQSATVPKWNPLKDSSTGPQRSNSSRQPERRSKADWI